MILAQYLSIYTSIFMSFWGRCLLVMLISANDLVTYFVLFEKSLGS